MKRDERLRRILRKAHRCVQRYLDGENAERLIKKTFDSYKNPESMSPACFEVTSPSGDSAVVIEDETAKICSEQLLKITPRVKSRTMGEMRPSLSEYFGRVIASQKLGTFGTESQTVLRASYGQQRMGKLAMDSLTLYVAGDSSADPTLMRKSST